MLDHKVSNCSFVDAIVLEPLPLNNVILPQSFVPHTELLELQPLSVNALQNPMYQSLYEFSHFNVVQTQMFHCLYHTDNNVLLGAPTGSGKTIAAEIAMFRLFNVHPKLKVIWSISNEC
jgi:activating signal cointegrator complex subunit 3